MMLASELRFAVPHATFALEEVALGLYPTGNATVENLPRILQVPKLVELSGKVAENGWVVWVQRVSRMHLLDGGGSASKFAADPGKIGQKCWIVRLEFRCLVQL